MTEKLSPIEQQQLITRLAAELKKSDRWDVKHWDREIVYAMNTRKTTTVQLTSTNGQLWLDHCFAHDGSSLFSDEFNGTIDDLKDIVPM